MFNIISLMTYIHNPGRIFDNLTTRTMSNHWIYTQMFQVISLLIYTRVPGHIIDKIRTSSC